MRISKKAAAVVTGGLLAGGGLIYAVQQAPAESAVAASAAPAAPVAQALGREIAPTAEFTGYLAAPETVELRPKAGGTIQSVSVPEGGLVRQGQFWLSDTPEFAGSVGWNALFPRTATWAELRHRPSGLALAFLNTHFDLMPEAIVNSARLVRGWAERTAARLPVVIGGDFNADKSSAAYEMLADGRTLADAWRLANATGADEATFHAFGQPGVAAQGAFGWCADRKPHCLQDGCGGRKRLPQRRRCERALGPVHGEREWRQHEPGHQHRHDHHCPDLRRIDGHEVRAE